MGNGSARRDFLVWGYQAGILLSFLGMIGSAIYLFAFLQTSPAPAVADEVQLLSITAERRLLLLSTAIFVGMSFGFLGFALFLIQAKGDLDLEADVGDYKLKLARVSPGLFVILCATVIIVVAATFRIDYQVGNRAAPGAGDEPFRSVSTDTVPDVTTDALGIPSPDSARADTTGGP